MRASLEYSDHLRSLSRNLSREAERASANDFDGFAAALQSVATSAAGWSKAIEAEHHTETEALPDDDEMPIMAGAEG